MNSNSTKTFFVSNLKDLISKSNKKWLPYSIFNEKIAIKFIEDELNGINILKIWKTNTIFDYGYENFSFENFIIFLCYKKTYNSIKIESLTINEPNLKILNELNELNKINNVIEFIINFLKKIAINININKIIIEVHKDLKIYKKIYKNIGFVLTNILSYDNPDYKQAELEIY